MRILKQVGLVLVAACAFSAMAVSSASALLPRFLVHPFAILLAKTLTNQVFTTAGGSVVCEQVKLLNTAALALVVEVQHATVDYEKCTAFGLAATVSPVLYLLHADGTVDLANSPVIKALACEVKVFPKNGLKDVLYRNLHGALAIVSHVSSIESEGKGAACTYAKESKGVYEGVIDVWVDAIGAIIIWHPS